MSGMEQIEAAVGEDDFLSGRLEAARLLCDGISRMDRHVWNLQSVSIASPSSRRTTPCNQVLTAA